MSERELFIAALQKGSDDRPAFLDQACPDDPELRRRVEILLKAHEMAGGLLDLPGRTGPMTDVANAPTVAPVEGALNQGPATGLTDHSTPRPITEGPGMRIGPYKLLQEIGEGGMGTVSMAEQEHPVRRRVALKIIKPGMDSAQVIARFEAERQALALMDHPNIARVLDAGTTDGARPYFVMELVNGIPITRYCDEARLNPRERLELFVPVCQAIQHAHQKGIIHRDIKPSNVLVTLYDGKPVPKVIDFGIAKATAQRLTEKTMFTQFGSIVGTLEYMSPEQAEMSALGVDTRSDIYSLGVLLYELLTGTTPLERAQVREAAYVEILRRIKEEEPPRPSTRLSASKEALPSISAQRRTDPGRLAKVVRGDLDWIVMKSLEKDRSRRYESASGLARDVQRHLDGDAVEACPPSAIYRLRKFARKHRASLATATALAALLVLATVLTAWQAVRAIQAEQMALREAHRAKEAEARALHQEEHARRSAAESQAVLKFLKDEILTAARPEGQEGGKGKDVTIRRALDDAEPKIAGAFPGQPTIEAVIRDVLGVTYYYLGEPARAIRELERALELGTSRLGADHPSTLTYRNNLAAAYLSAGQFDRAIPLLERTLAAKVNQLGPDHPDTLRGQHNLASAYQNAGQLDRAIALFERTLAARVTKFGPEHPATLLTQHQLASAYRNAGQFDRAIRLLERTLAARTAQLGPDHPEILMSQNILAMAYRNAGQLDRAIPLLERTLTALVSKLGPDHPQTLLSQNNLALAYQNVGQLDRAIALFERTLAIQVAKLGANHPDTFTTRANLAGAYREAGQLDRAIALLEGTVASRRAKLGADHPETLIVQNNLASAYRETGRLAEAIALLEGTAEAMRTKLGSDHPDTLAVLSNLGWAFQAQGELARAEAIHRDVLTRRKAKFGTDHADFANGLAYLGSCLLEQGKWGEAEAVLRECIRIRASKVPDDWRRFKAISDLGASLKGQKKYAEAEPLIVSGYEGMKAREVKIPAESRRHLTEAAERVVRLYEAWDKPEKAAAWREKLKIPAAGARSKP
jgi:serine/threonine protein kinase/tetratricopeptide (TPR) repeat protein